MQKTIIALGLAIVLCVASRAAAQVTTGGLRGTVVAKDDGVTIAEAEVILLHRPSGSQKTVASSASGTFAFTGLRVGGPYQLTVNAPGFLPEIVDGISLSAGKVREITVKVRLTEEIIEIASEYEAKNTASKTVIDARQIAEMPTIGRDPKAVLRMTPNASVEGPSLSIAGANNRFNSVTVDGIRQDDDFGLNANGYPTRRSPIGLGAIEQISVESSPFDVRYGRFLGGNVNIVTKSGSNDWSGSLFGTFANQSLTGDKTGSTDVDITFRDIRYGAALSGPLLKDKLHFLASVEGLDADTPVDVGAAGSGAVNEVATVSVADVEAAQRIARDIYGFDAGAASRNLSEGDLKVLGKLDWTISSRHRAALRYQRTDGNNIAQTSPTDTTLPLSSHWYDNSATLNTLTARLLSDWTDHLSTDVELSGKLVENDQIPLNGNGFMKAIINTADRGQILLGPDEFRHQNRLANDLYHGKAEANYLLGRHLITGGWDVDHLQIFNLFVPSSNGIATYDSLADFEAMRPSEISYSNAVSGNPDDAAADWTSTTHALYLQDQFEATSSLTVTGGLRYERYSASKGIENNQKFFDRHGFANTATLDGKQVLLPRLGLSFRPATRINVHGGLGLYAGGTPNVWVSNSYTNDGVTIDSAFSDDAAIIEGFDGRNIPQALADQLEAGDGNVDATDPNFKIPQNWKASTGMDVRFDIPGLGDAGTGVELNLNYTYTRARYGVKWLDLRRDLASLPNNTPVGILPDGRPLYDFDNSDGRAFNSRRGFDMLLTNDTQGRSESFTVALQKQFPFGLFVGGTYAFTRARDNGTGNSTRSVSNYDQVAVSDPQSPELGISSFERPHRLTGTLVVQRPLIASIAGCKSERCRGWQTSFSMFVESRSGQPYSYVFADANQGSRLAGIFGEERQFARRNRQLFYVPTGDETDVVLDGITQEDFDNFLNTTGLSRYRGRIAPRNAFTSPWYHRFDVRLSQDLPNPLAGNRARLVVDVENVGNLLNAKWGQLKQTPFPYMAPAVDVDYDAASGRYIYRNLRTADPTRVDVFSSIWRMSVGLMVDF